MTHREMSVVLFGFYLCAYLSASKSAITRSSKEARFAAVVAQSGRAFPQSEGRVIAWPGRRTGPICCISSMKNTATTLQPFIYELFMPLLMSEGLRHKIFPPTCLWSRDVSAVCMYQIFSIIGLTNFFTLQLWGICSIPVTGCLVLITSFF